LKDRVASHIEELMEQRLGARGFGLHETAVLAGTLEHLVRDEALDRLQASYTALGFPRAENVSEANMDEILDTFMILYILGDHIAARGDLTSYKAQMNEVYPAWSQTQSFVREVRRNNTAVPPPSSQLGFDFAAAVHITEELGERHGRFQNAECVEMKDQLIQLEGHQAGRVRLSDFHGAAFGFTENAEDLRQVGALDESQVGEPSVIVPNYISAPSNCIASSSFYSVCCISECENLLRHLENEIAAPSVDPQQLLKIVGAMPSSTVRAPRKLPASVARQLVEVADMQGGSVKLHSHLFSEWMHHVYPRECPKPHFSEGTAPLTADEWLESALNATESTQEIPSADVDSKSSQEPAIPISPAADVQRSIIDKSAAILETENPIEPGNFGAKKASDSNSMQDLTTVVFHDKPLSVQERNPVVEAASWEQPSEDFETDATSPFVPTTATANRSGKWAMVRIVVMGGLLSSMAYLASEKCELALAASRWQLGSAKKLKHLDHAFAEKAFV